MKLNDWPGERVGELRRLPESEVIVCGTLSLFTHVTFVPLLIDKSDGLNAKLSMLTFISALDVLAVVGISVTFTLVLLLNTPKYVPRLTIANTTIAMISFLITFNLFTPF